ncbi:MAG TPA: septum site-determining protein MinD [Candidatus Aenigmarchaeota archaeon]|nr:septum site-determining protein MinD [Candidatus Aenigmarchaeota archaeon]
MARILCVASGKGGVGKTTAVINLGAALFHFGQRVLIVDGNVTTPNLSLHLGIAKEKPTLHDVLEGSVNIENAIHLHSSGLMVIPAGISLTNLKKIYKKTIAQAITGIVGRFDWVLIDVPAGLGKEARLAIEAANEVVVVTNPELPAAVDALKVSRLAKNLGTSPLGVIVNKFAGEKGEMSPENVAEFVELPLLGVIPYSNLFLKALSAKYPLVLLYPNSTPAVQYKKIAAALLGEKYEIIEKPSIIQRIRRFLRAI